MQLVGLAHNLCKIKLLKTATGKKNPGKEVKKGLKFMGASIRDDQLVLLVSS